MDSKLKMLAMMWAIVALFMVVGFTSSRAGQHTSQVPDSYRPTNWAKALQKPGLPNLFQVSPMLYRGAQPGPKGIAQLQAMGIKTIICLRGFHDDPEDPLEAASLGYVRIRFHTWHPEEQDMVRFLKVMNDPTRQPVFVHCKRGIDRT